MPGRQIATSFIFEQRSGCRLRGAARKRLLARRSAFSASVNFDFLRSGPNGMYEQNQLFVADSFMALFVAGGRPTLTRKEIETRYDTCEDLASQVAEFCKTLQFSHDLSEQDALRRCHQGLVAPEAMVSADEALWVIRRVAELLTWDRPAWLDGTG